MNMNGLFNNNLCNGPIVKKSNGLEKSSKIWDSLLAKIKQIFPAVKICLKFESKLFQILEDFSIMLRGFTFLVEITARPFLRIDLN